MAWLVRDGEVLAAVEIAATGRDRRRGLMHRESFDGALVLRPCRNVHTAGMRFAIDVAFCDAEGPVQRTSTLAPWRISPIVLRAAFAVEAEAGAFDRWRLARGDRLELRA